MVWQTPVDTKSVHTHTHAAQHTTHSSSCVSYSRLLIVGYGAYVLGHTLALMGERVARVRRRATRRIICVVGCVCVRSLGMLTAAIERLAAEHVATCTTHNRVLFAAAVSETD